MPRSTKVFKKRVIWKKKPRPTLVECTPDLPPNLNQQPSPSSSSSKKISSGLQYYKKFNEDFQYDIVDVDRLQKSLAEIGVCKSCFNTLTIKRRTIVGLASELQFQCDVCKHKVMSTNCESIEIKYEKKKDKNDKKDKTITLYDLNIRLVYGLRSIGKGKAGADMMCAAMNLSPPPHRYFRYEEFLASVSDTVCKESMKNAVEDAVVINENSRDLAVAVDGSWQKRGHTSLNGIVSLTSLDTGKVLDIDVLSKYCTCPGRLEKHHQKSCLANFSGSSGMMEVTGAVNIFGRSVPNYNVRYLEYLGDGDSKAYSEVCSTVPYGKNVKIQKIECVGHIQKRMGSRLKTLKQKKTVLPDGSKVGGKNRLTNVAILQIQEYYKLAILRNLSSVKEMQAAVWAEYFHLLSSDEKPQHSLCPGTEDTWCKFRKASQNNEAYDHTKHFHLPEGIMIHIKPVFKALADPKLLEKCVKGKTQNVNESLNNVIWTFVPKKTFVRLNTLKFGVCEAVTYFNDGNIGKCKLFEKCSLRPGKQLVSAMWRLDRRRIAKADKCHDELQKKIRQAQHKLKRKLEDEYEEEEADNPSYAPGMY